jgi:hypothetical protein
MGMSEDEIGAAGTDWDRVAVIQRLCKGPGVLAMPNARLDLTWERFGVRDEHEFVNLMEVVFQVAPEWNAIDAIKNALGLGFMDPATERMIRHLSLTERREALAAHMGVSVRTVMRLERNGAVVVDGYVRRFTDDDPSSLIFMTMFAAAWLDERQHKKSLDLDPQLTANLSYAASDLMADYVRKRNPSKPAKIYESGRD